LTTLTGKEIEEILREAGQHPHAAVACIDALKIVQHYNGWVSDEAVVDIAELLGMTHEDVESVATFYSRIYRRPVGRNVILICDSISCMIMGYESLYKYLSDRLGIRFGETTADGRFTLLPISCLGDCDHAPAMMINNDHFNNLTILKIDEQLEKYK
jgi:NADH-quinone oxidoreductase subunit E